jgi:hypothetical protein
MPGHAPTNEVDAQKAGTAELLREVSRLVVGLTSLVVDVAVDTVQIGRRLPHGQQAASEPLDALIGLGLFAGRTVSRAASTVERAVRPIAEPVWRHLPSGPTAWMSTKLRQAADLGREERQIAERDVSVVSRRLAARLAPLVLDQLDLTAEVLERVDLDAIVKSIDVDAVVGRLDFTSVVDRIPIQRVVDRLDLNELVARVDLDTVVSRVDIDKVVSRVDVDGVVATVDLDAVIDRVDLVSMAEELIAALNLPEIIRTSTGGVAADVVRGARVQSMAADESVNRLVNRVFRRRSTRPAIPPAPEQSDGEQSGGEQ